MSHIIEVVERYSIPDIPQLDLPEEDGIPLESDWHRAQMNLLIDVVKHRWRLGERGYTALKPDEQGRLWSNQLEAWLGTWEGTYLHTSDTWLRLFADDGTLIPTEAETERRRAEAAEAELVRWRAALARQQEEEDDNDE